MWVNRIIQSIQWQLLYEDSVADKVVVKAQSYNSDLVVIWDVDVNIRWQKAPVYQKGKATGVMWNAT